MAAFSSLASWASLLASISLSHSDTSSRPLRLELGERHGIVAEDLKVGAGKLIEDGDKVTIQYRVCDSADKELANSIKRGMPFTFVYGDRNSDPLVSVALAGMRVGGSRRALLPADSLPEGIGSIVPPKTDLVVWVYVIAAKRLEGGKVESPDAERAQGALEVPRAAAHNGSA